MHPIPPKNASIQGNFSLQTHDSLIGIELKSLGGTFSIEAFLRFRGKIVKSYRVSCRVIVCSVGAIVCIVRVIVCRVELPFQFCDFIIIKGLPGLRCISQQSFGSPFSVCLIVTVRFCDLMNLSFKNGYRSNNLKSIE